MKSTSIAIFWSCLGVSVALLITSFFLPPTGQIDPSVLKGVAELLAFASLGVVVAAIKRGIPAKLTHGDTSISVGKDNDNGEAFQGE